MFPQKRHLPGRGTGGWKQSGKMRKVEGGAVVGPIAEAANMDTPSDSVLGAFLLHAIFWGMMSVTISQKIAALAIADGARGKSLERLAQCGGERREQLTRGETYAGGLKHLSLRRLVL